MWDSIRIMYVVILLLVLNRIAGSADEMTNSIRETKINMGKLVKKNNESNKLIEELKDQLHEVLKENEVKKADRKKLEEKVSELEKSNSNGILDTISLKGNIAENNTLDLLLGNDSGISSFKIEDGLIVKSPTSTISMTEGLYSTNRYLSGYIHPAIKVKDEDKEE